MSSSSYSSVCSSSSDSDSDSSSSTSSSSRTGSFSDSDAKSLSSCSTVIPPQPRLRRFGSPEYNYFWIENKSKSNPKLSYFYNYKSHAVVWKRPVPEDVCLPFYTSWIPVKKEIKEDDQNLSDLVSDFEDDEKRKKRNAVKRRNRRLLHEEQNNEVEVLTVKKTMKSKKMLDTFWKLYRHPGESVNDVKERLLVDVVRKNAIKQELPDYIDNEQNVLNASIKTEPIDDNEDPLKLNHIQEPSKDEEDSDPDIENVSYLIKQEYAMNYDVSESENEDGIPNPRNFTQDYTNDSDDMDSDKSSDDESEEELDYQNLDNGNVFTNGEEVGQFDNDDYDYDYEAPNLPFDCLDVEITEENEENILPNNSLVNNPSIDEETINWTFEKSSMYNNSSLTCSAINSVYKAPKLKEISNKHLCTKKRKSKQKKINKTKAKKVPKLVIKTSPSFHIKSESESDIENKPIVCDMYGNRTINYNSRPPKTKIPQWQCCTKLSDSEDSGNEQRKVPKLTLQLINPYRKLAPKEMITDKSKPESALQLKNWFPKQRNSKRKRQRKNSDSSWNESNLSGYSEVDDREMIPVRIKREKRSSDEEQEKEEKEEIDSRTDDYLVKSIKKEPEEIAEEKEIIIKQEIMEEEEQRIDEISTPVNPVDSMLDLSIVKVERRSPDPEEEPPVDANAVVKLEENSADTEDSSSSSSSCACSRSSCSCQSSSDEEENNAGDQTALENGCA